MKKLLFILLLSLVSCTAFARHFNIQAGPIWSNADAQTKCPAVCTSHHSQWTGQWSTVGAGQSVCQCKRHHRFPHRHNRLCEKRDVATQTLMDNADAQNQCPTVCKNARGRWNGQWTNRSMGNGAVCGCMFCWVRR